jgi:Tol biopolymer transport system component/C-terminal processing protease CtpA/Prc
MSPNRFLLGLVILLFAATARAAVDPVPDFAQPAVSPDGSEIAFVSGGNLWTVPATGGDARLLITGAGDLARPLYSPVGHLIALISNRTGNGDIYLFNLDSGALTRLTYDDAVDRLDAFSKDGKWVWFSNSGHNAGGGMNEIYRVPVTGGTPMAVIGEPYQNHSQAAPSPDGHTVAFVDGGMATGQWWRHGHAHIDESAIWTADIRTDPPVYARVTGLGAKNLWPMYSPDARTLYFTSDRDGCENLYSVKFPRVRRPKNPKPVVGPPAETPLIEPEQLTNFHTGRLLWPTISADGKTIAFERDFAVWTLAIDTGIVQEVPIHLRGLVAGPTVEHQTRTNGVSDLVVSHDGKKMAFVIHGRLFACPAWGNGPGPSSGSAGSSNGGPAFAVTDATGIASNIAWANDDRRIVFASTKDGPRHLYLYDFAIRKSVRLTDTPGNDAGPMFAPDDSAVVYQRDGTQLREVDLSQSTSKIAGMFGASSPTRPGVDRLLTDKLSFEKPPFDAEATPVGFSPAGDWIAAVSAGRKGFRNLYLVPAAGGDPKQVSFLANAQSNSVAWATDGSALFFGSGQRTEDFQLARVDLVPRTPKFKGDQFSDLFRDHPSRPLPERSPRQPSNENPVDDSSAAADAPVTTQPTTRPTDELPTTRPVAPGPVVKPTPASRGGKTNIVFDDIDQRLSLLPVGVDVSQVCVSPDGHYVAFVGTTAGRTQVYAYPADPQSANAVPRPLTATFGYKQCLQFAPDYSNPTGNPARLYYVEDGTIHSVPVNGGSVQESPVSAELDVDFDHDKMVVFNQAWQYIDEGFHDPKFNGVDWQATRDHFAPHMAGARTPYEERRVLSLMIGELNASHLSVDGPATTAAPVGHLGLSFDRTEYESTGRLKVASVIPNGPADLGKLAAGDFILAVDGHVIDRSANLDSLLEQKLDKEVLLVVSKTGEDAGAHAVRMQTISGATERTLLYRAWVRANRAYVARASGGKLGYVHLADMTQQGLTRLYTDLDAQNENYDGVVVDVRNNNGGFTNGYAIDVFARQNYVTIEPRGFPKMPGRAALGQRSLGLPTVLVTNRETLSDGEDFTEGYRALKLGPVVGEPTAGWIIFTRGCPLLDGTEFRIPSETVFDAQGKPMEQHPRTVDVAVERKPGQAAAGKDVQLDAAVKALAGRLESERPGSSSK